METITAEELKKKIDGYDVMVLLDVRPAEDYQQAHLKGAISLPFSRNMQQEARAFLKKEDDIIVYADSDVVEEAFRLLKKNGYPKLRAVLGGMSSWRAGGFEVTNKVSMG